MSMCEKHILGDRTRVIAVRPDDSDPRQWLAPTPICTQLGDYHIAHCGIMHAWPPFEVVRIRLSGTYFFACFQGEGQVLIDGEWRTVGAGKACVQPPFIPNAVKARGKKVWKFCWVRYQEAPKMQPIVSIHSPTFGDFNVEPLQNAIAGLHAEAAQDASPHALAHWAELVHVYVQMFAQPLRGDDRLTEMWQAVEQQLADDWTLDRLARVACLSKEHLRRLCLSTLGRSPGQHLAFLRMHRAAELLKTTDQKVAHVGKQVGYSDPFAFSNTFQRWIGCRPSTYRNQG